LSRVENRLAMTERFLGSDMFKLSGLEAEPFRRMIEARCSNAGDFLRLFMDAVVQSQGKERWAETTPVHVQHIPEIKATLPDALFVHVIRDGRDVAVSMMKQGWIRPLRKHATRPELAAGAFWGWVVDNGHRLGQRVGGDYLEVKYERLTESPQAVLDTVGAFIGQPLSHEEIVRNGVGSVSRPNTSFPGKTASFTGRWRDELDESRARQLEALLEPTLHRHQYEVETDLTAMERWRGFAMRTAYWSRFGLRQAAKRTSFARSRISLELFEPGAIIKA
jgi:hypothetical protein